MSVNKRQRFEIFKRDSFTCQYCGRRPPDVVLECDHVLPVAEGGGDERTNLVTACFDCNRGKACGLLTDKPPALAEEMKREREREEQLSYYNRWLKKKRQRIKKDLSAVSAEFVDAVGEDPSKYTMTPDMMERARYFITMLPAEEVKEAAFLTGTRLRERSNQAQIKYFCGICWRKIKRDLL